MVGFFLFLSFFCGIFIGLFYIKIKNALKILFKEGPKSFLRKIYNHFKKHPTVQAFVPQSPVSFKTLHQINFSDYHPPALMKTQAEHLRINLMIDSWMQQTPYLNSPAWLILVTELANTLEIPLRIISRNSLINPYDFFSLLKYHQINKPVKIEFYSDEERLNGGHSPKLEISEKDVFFATSWSTALVVECINLRKQFFYILNECEKNESSHHQQSLQQALKSTHLHFITYSSSLVKHPEKPVINGNSFRAAFPQHINFSQVNAFKNKTKRKFLYYASSAPQDHTFIGLKVIENSLIQGILDESWEIYIIQEDLPPFVFSNGTQPQIINRPSFNDYLDLVKNVDLCLIFHDSYSLCSIALEVIAYGGVVLTNIEDVVAASHSKNMITSSLDLESLLSRLQESVDLVLNVSKRESNYNESSIEKAWNKTLDASLKYIHQNL